MDSQTNPYRKILATTVSCLLMKSGFHSVEPEALASLVEMLQAFIFNIGHLSKNYCELSGRCEPLFADVILAFVDIGFDSSTLDSYIKSGRHIELPELETQDQPKPPTLLAAGTKQPLQSYIPSHFPQFPDPYTYIRTPTHKQPLIDYESVREKAAVQNRDIERALTKFLSKTQERTHNLFDVQENNIFPLIIMKPQYPPYLSAFLPQDQIFDPEDLDSDPKTLILRQQKEHKEAKKEAEQKNVKGKEQLKTTENNAKTNELPEVKKEEEITQTNQNSFIDNPYLKAAKMPSKDYRNY